MTQSDTATAPTSSRRVLTISFVLTYAIALAPPVYIGLTRERAVIASIPVPVWYLLLVSAGAILAMTALWVSERSAGELD